MGSLEARLARLRAESPSNAARLIFRKLVYRKVVLRRYEIKAAESLAPSMPFNLQISFLEATNFDQASGTSPYLTSEDVERFRQQDSICIVVRDGDRVAASSWMTSGNVYVPELHRFIHVPQGEHLSCRTYVNPDYRGRALMSHMIHAYSQRLSPGDVVWGPVYERNVASIRSIERIGWRHTGDYWTRFIFGKKLPGERHFAARSPETLGGAG